MPKGVGSSERLSSPEKPVAWANLSSRISIALGAYDIKLDSQRALKKTNIFSGPLLWDWNSQIVTFWIRQAQNKPGSQIRAVDPVTPFCSTLLPRVRMPFRRS